MIVFKLATNTLAWAALRTDRGVLWLASVRSEKRTEDRAAGVVRKATGTAE